MPIEIRELHIRVAVSAPAGSGAPAGAPTRAGGDDGSREAIVAACVERVMELLRDRGER
jgi:Family of unknown function (DUF5908)